MPFLCSFRHAAKVNSKKCGSASSLVENGKKSPETSVTDDRVSLQRLWLSLLRVPEQGSGTPAAPSARDNPRPSFLPTQRVRPSNPFPSFLSPPAPQIQMVAALPLSGGGGVASGDGGGAFGGPGERSERVRFADWEPSLGSGVAHRWLPRYRILAARPSLGQMCLGFVPFLPRLLLNSFFLFFFPPSDFRTAICWAGKPKVRAGPSPLWVSWRAAPAGPFWPSWHASTQRHPLPTSPKGQKSLAAGWLLLTARESARRPLSRSRQSQAASFKTLLPRIPFPPIQVMVLI